MRGIIFILIFLWTSPFVAQMVPNDYISLNEELIRRGYPEDGKNEDYAGSSFWEEEYIPGEVIRKGKKEMEAFFRYNVLRDEVHIKTDPKEVEYYRLPRWGDLEYKTDKYTYFLSHKVTEDRRSLYGYFIRYFQSENIAFYGKPVAEVLPAQRPETSYDKGRPAPIKVRSHYYIQIENRPLVEVKIREKDFRRLFKESKRMRTYFKEHRVNNLHEVVKMLKFYEEGS